MHKHILIAFKDSFPEGMASTSRVHQYCKILKSNGYRVTVLTLSKKGSGLSLEYVDEVQALSVPSLPGWIAIFLGSLVQAFVFNKWLYAHRAQYTHVLLYAFRGYAHTIARIVCPHLKYYLELNELPYSFKGSIKDYIPFLNSIRRWLMTVYAFPVYDGVIAISHSLSDFAKKHCKKGALVVCVPVLIDQEEVPARIPMSLPKPYIFHAGYLNEQKDGILEVFKAFALASQQFPELHFYLTVRKAEQKTLDAIDQLIRQYGLEEKVHFLGFITKEEIYQHLLNADLVVLNKPDNLQNRYNFPTKISEYMLYGLPIVYGGDGEARRYLVNGQNALLKDSNPDMLAQGIIELLSNAALREKIGIGAKQTALQFFDWKKHINVFSRL